MGCSPWGRIESDRTEAHIQNTDILLYDIIYGLYNIYINDLIYRFM